MPHDASGLSWVHKQVYATKWRQAQEEGLPQPPLSAGFTYELCAGIIDKSKSLEAIAQEEVAPLFRTLKALGTITHGSAPIQWLRAGSPHSVVHCTIQVLEESGFDVPVEAVLPVASYVSSTGISGSKHVMFWVSVDESMRANGGGGLA